jgi:ACS family sodium-dependent inorganic phosphate cotransporter
LRVLAAAQPTQRRSPPATTRERFPPALLHALRLPPSASTLRALLSTAVAFPREQLRRLNDASPTEAAAVPAAAAAAAASAREVATLVALATAVSFICSIDRAAMSVAILPMSVDFAWDDGVKGAVASSFFAGYMVTNLCGGLLATRFSAKGVLAAGVVCWSCFTVATPLAAGEGHLATLLAARTLMGVGEGVAYPSIQVLVTRHVPEAARSRALAFIYSGHQLGSIASYLTAPLLIATLGWQSVFWAFGALGFVWVAGWVPLTMRSELPAPGDAAAAGADAAKPAALGPGGGDATLRLQDVPWADFARSKPFWAIVAAQVSVAVGSCLSFSWLPTFYSQQYGLDVASSAAFTVVPFVGTVAATNAAGWIADAMVNNGVLTKTQTRRLMQGVGSLGPAVCLIKLAADQGEGGGHGDVGEAVAMVTAWLALGGFSAAGYGSNHQDISARWAGVLFGLSNGLASVAGSASIYATGRILHTTHDWGLIFDCAAATYAVGALVYLKYASAEKQFE